jgi:hypothetical protein
MSTSITLYVLIDTNDGEYNVVGVYKTLGATSSAWHEYAVRQSWVSPEDHYSPEYDAHEIVRCPFES